MYVRGEQLLGSEDKEVRQRAASGSVGWGGTPLAQDGYALSYDTFSTLFLAVTPWGRGDRAPALVTSTFNVSVFCITLTLLLYLHCSHSFLCVFFFVIFFVLDYSTAYLLSLLMRLDYVIFLILFVLAAAP